MEYGTRVRVTEEYAGSNREVVGAEGTVVRPPTGFKELYVFVEPDNPEHALVCNVILMNPEELEVIADAVTDAVTETGLRTPSYRDLL